MAIIKASYTCTGVRAKAAVRYIENRPGKDGGRTVRTLFHANGKVERAEVYQMIDQAVKGSYFFRLVISPDPTREDSDKNLDLRELADKTIQSVEERFQQPVQWVAAIHADHAEHRHIHVIAIVPGRLTVQDLYQMRTAATEEACEQGRQLELTRVAQEQRQEHSEGVGLELSW
ncbi:MAG TPA: hypothetical protein VJ761_17700 [Ktedonobacteraceae bacterium]|nr:hypothetical protein [Ktedonobacteraceae bacterium]